MNGPCSRLGIVGDASARQRARPCGSGCRCASAVDVAQIAEDDGGGKSARKVTHRARPRRWSTRTADSNALGPLADLPRLQGFSVRVVAHPALFVVVWGARGRCGSRWHLAVAVLTADAQRPQRLAQPSSIQPVFFVRCCGPVSAFSSFLFFFVVFFFSSWSGGGACACTQFVVVPLPTVCTDVPNNPSSSAVLFIQRGSSASSSVSSASASSFLSVLFVVVSGGCFSVGGRRRSVACSVAKKPVPNRFSARQSPVHRVHVITRSSGQSGSRYNPIIGSIGFTF